MCGPGPGNWPAPWTTCRRRATGSEYSVGNLSVLIVRGDDGVLRGFQNVCRHRGNVLCTGSGSGLTKLRCIYHRWSWTLDGKLREVPSRRGFGALRNDDYPLFPVQVGTWGPLVFVNLDLDAEPLDEYLEAIPGLWMGPHGRVLLRLRPHRGRCRATGRRSSRRSARPTTCRNPPGDAAQLRRRQLSEPPVRPARLAAPALRGAQPPAARRGHRPGDLGLHNRHSGGPLRPRLQEPGAVPAGSRRGQREGRAGRSWCGPTPPPRA